MMQELRLNVLEAGRGRGGGEARGVVQPQFVAPPAPVAGREGVVLNHQEDSFPPVIIVESWVI